MRRIRCQAISVSITAKCPLWVTDIEGFSPDVRFTPESGHYWALPRRPLCADSGLMHCSNDGHIQRRTFATKLSYNTPNWPRIFASSKGMWTQAIGAASKRAGCARL